MGRSNGVVGRPVALQGEWDSALALFRDGNVDTIDSGSFSYARVVGVANDATTHTMGSWVEIVASTAEEYSGLVLIAYSTSASSTDSSRLLDVGIGPAASEVAIATSIDIGWQASSASVSSEIDLPVRIPKGSRIALRSQGAMSASSKNISLTAVLKSRSGLQTPSVLVPLGVNTGTSSGVTLTAPSSANTKSAWTEIVSSTPQAFRAIIAQFGLPSGTTAQPSSQHIQADVAVGASGSEVVISGNQWMYSTTSENLQGQQRYRTVFTRVPAGSRIAARYQAGLASIVLSGSIIGVPY